MVHTHLVTWQEFLREKENKNLPIMEAKAKYLKLQRKFELLMEAEIAAAFVASNAQLSGAVVGGPKENLNPAVSIKFNITTGGVVAGFTATATVTYKFPVFVSGTPFIVVNNSQAGGGTAATVNFDYSSGSGTTQLVFSYQQFASVNGTGNVASNTVVSGSSLFGAITTSPTTPVEGDYTEFATYAQGTGGTGGDTVTLAVSISALQTVTSCTVKSATSGVFTPGNTLTVAGSEFGGSGDLVITLRSEDLGNDVLTFSQEGDGVTTGIVNFLGSVISLSQDGSPGEDIGTKYNGAGIGGNTAIGTGESITA
jgi:hypothetical protein